MEDGAALDAAGARELQEERERCQKMKQENQVLLKKLHDVVGRYRQLQQQYQTMVNERQEHQQELHDAAGATMSGTTTDAKSSAMGGGESPTNHGNATDDPALKKLEAEKHELIEKLKQVVGTCRLMQKQLQEAKEENEALKSPAKPMLTGSHHDATEALEVRVIALEREVAQKEEEKEEIVGKLKEVISRYQSLQKQLEDKICEHDAAMTKVAALEMELRTQQSSSSSSSSSSVSWIRRSSGGSNSTNNGSTDQQLQAKEKEITKLKEDVQKLTIAITQEEARTAVFREENARLKEQVASIMQETQQQEQHLRDENSSFAQQIAELQRQAELMKKQQEDSEHLYMEVASKLNHTLRENGDLQDRMVSLQQSIQEAEQAREHAASEHAAHIARLEQQLSAAEAAHVNSSVHEDEIAEMKLQIDKLTLRESRLISLESDLADHGVGTAYSSIAELIQAKEHSYQENISLHSRQIEELRSQLEVKSDLESTLISLREQSTEQSLIIAKLQEELTCMTEERDAALIAKDSEVESLRCTHDQEICRLREQIERLESQLGTNNESASLVEQQLNDLRVQLEASAKETIAKDQAISEKQGQLVELESKFQNAQNALDETKRMLDESVEENEALRKTIAEGEAAHAELKCAFAEVEARYAHDGRTRIEELESQLSVKVSVVEELTCELQSVRAQLEESVALCKTAAAAEQKKLEAATARSKELEEFVAKLKEQLTGVYATVEHDQQVVVSQLNERIVHFESEVSEREARLTKAMEDIVQLNHQVSTLRDELASTQASALEEKEALVTAHMAVISSLQQQLADSFNEHEEELKEKSEKLEEAERDISALRNQVATWKAQQRQIDADSNEVVNDLQEQVARLQSECESARKEVEKVQEDKSGLEERVADTEGHLDRVVAEKDRELDAVRSGLEKEVERLCGEVNTLQEELASARRESDQYAQQVEVIQGQLAALPLTRREIVGEETNDSTTVSMDALLEDLRMNLAKAEEYERQMSEISSATSTLRDQLACATTEMGLAESRCASFENEIQSLNDQLQSVRVEKDHLHAEIKALQSELLRRSEIIESLKAEDASKEDQKTIQLNERIAELTATVSDTENELAAIKAENTRMVFEVAKTTDSAVKLKQDYDQVQVQHKSKCDEVDSLKLLVQEVESRSALLTQDIQEKARLIDELQGELSSLQESTTTSLQEMQTRLEASSAEIERLKDELSNTSDLNERLQSELDATKTAVEEVKRLEEELTQSKECIESMLEQKRNLIEQISIGNSERTTLTDELSSLQSSSTERINYLEARIESMASELRAINDQLERTQGEKRSIEEHVQALEAELKAKASDVQSLTEQITLVQEEKTGCEAHAEALEATVTAKTVELRSLNEEIAGLREENISLSQQIERITTAASSHSSEVSQLTEDLIALRKEKSEMEATIDEKTIEMDALREELKLMVENKRTLEEKVQHLEEQVELLKQSSSEQTTQLEASHKTLLSKVQDLTSEIESLREAAEMNAQEHQHLQDSIREKEGAMETLQDECVTLTSKLEIVSSDLSTRDAHFEGLIAQKDGVIRELQDQLAAVSDRSSGLQSETRDLKEQILVKKKDAVAVSESLEQLVTLRTEVKESHIAIKERDDIAQELRVELDSLRTQCTQFESRVRELLQQLAENEEQIKLNRRLEEQLAELRELSKHHEASLSVKEESLRKLEDEVTLLSEQKMQLETQVKELKMQFELKGDDEDVVAALKEKVGALEAELRETTSSAEQIQTTQRQELEVLKASISQKDEIIGKLKTKTEEVLGMYKKLKEHAQDLQEQLTEKTTEAVSQHEEMESMLATHARLSEELVATKQASRALEDAMESMKRDQEQLSTATTGELSAAKADLEAMQLKYEEVTERLASEKDELTKEIAALQESKNDLIRTVQEKIDDHQRVEEQLKELQTRHDEMKLLHEQVISESSRLRSELEECCAEVVKLKEEHSGIGAVHEEMTTKLQEEVASLRAQLDVEIEGANAARTALEVYKKRAATALKKATYESKSSIKKVEEETTQLQQDFAEATAKVAALERELEEAQKQLEEAEAVSAAQVRAVKEKAEEEKSRDELEWKKALESVEGQLVSLRAELDAKSHLDVRISELEELNLSLSETVDSLKKEVQHKSEVSREMLKVKDNEIAELTKEVEEAKRAANEAAQQLKSAPLPSVSVFETPEQGRSSPRRSSAEHEHLAAAMADVQSSISMTVTTSTVSTNGVDGQIIQLARTQAMRDEESTKIKLQLQALEEQVRCFQTKYEDTLALLEESTRQKRRLQELSTRTTDGLNIEYLKNVVIKYIESQNPSEKDRLIPVIATVLHFSPQEMKKINDAHQKAHEEAGGLLGGVFSLFGAAPAAPPPKPLAIPANLNLRQPSPGSMASPGMEQDDDDDQMTPLNPFAANSY